MAKIQWIKCFKAENGGFLCRIKPWWGIGVIAAAIWAIYGQVLGHDFNVFDDPLYISKNSYVMDGLKWESVRWAFTNYDAGNWHPLTWLSHMLDCQLLGLRSGLHIGENVVWHMFNAIFVYIFVQKLFGSHWRALFVGLVFAIHPQNIEAVAWASQRKSLLNVFFSLLSLLAYIKYARSGKFKDYGWMLIAFMLSLLAKSMSVTLPVLMLLLDIWPLKRLISIRGVYDTSKTEEVTGMLVRGLKLIVEKLPLFVLVVWISYVTILAQDGAGAMQSLNTMPLWVRIVNAVLACAAYIKNAFLPSSLCVFYMHKVVFSRTEIVSAVVLLLLLCGVACATFRKRPAIALGWTWFLIVLLPVIGLVQVGSQARADRYFYFPSIGLIIMITGLFPVVFLSPRNNRLVSFGLGGAWVFSLCVYAYGQVIPWKSGTLLFSDALEHGGHYTGMYINLSSTYCMQYRYEEAFSTVEVALKEYPFDEGLIQNRAVILMQKDRFAEALDDLLRIQPIRWSNPIYQLTLALAYKQNGNDQMAMRSIRICRMLLPVHRQWDAGLEGVKSLMARTDFNMEMLRPRLVVPASKSKIPGD